MSLKSKIKRKFLEKYELWWENECDVYYEYKKDEPFHIIKKQVFLNANDINIKKYLPLEFPWHGYIYEDFEKLNIAMTKSLRDLECCNDIKGITKFKRKHIEVYEAYFRQPINVISDGNGGFKLLGDGRHRTYLAQKYNNVIPVWIVEYTTVDDVALELYKTHQAWGEWRFNWDFVD